MRWAVTLEKDEADAAVTVAEGEPAPGVPGRFHAVLIVEDVWTGDGRQFAADSLKWRDLPLPLMGLDSTTYAHEQAVLIGNIERIERQEMELHGWGSFLAAPDPEAANIIATITRGELRGVSADVDDVEYEIILPESEDDGLIMLFANDDDDEGDPDDEGTVIKMEDPKMRVTAGRIMGATVVPFPALQECFIEIDTSPVEEAAATNGMRFSGGTLTTSNGKQTLGEGVLYVAAEDEALGAVAGHSTGITDDAWDAAAQEGKLDSPMSVTTARNFYAWLDDDAIDGDEVPKAGGKFPHHMVGDNGAPGVANSHALAAAIGALNGARGGSSIPDADRKGVYDHLAKHYRDNDLEPPELRATEEAEEPEGVTASAVPVAPPASWFAPPSFTEAMPLTITDDGQVLGHVAAWTDCHIAYPNECKRAPRSSTDYAYFHTGELRLDDDSRIAVGHLCVRGGHADRALSAARAMAHYDDTDSCVADIVIGEDRWGIWCAGALRPDTDPRDVRVAMASGVSGDWRPIGNGLELVALSSINTPGFIRPRRALFREERGLVASAIIDLPPVRSDLAARVIEHLANSIGRGVDVRIAEQYARVHG